MAVPKKKQSKSRGDKRAANWKARPRLRRVPAVQAAQAPAPGVRQLRLLRRPAGGRGRVDAVSRAPDARGRGARALGLARARRGVRRRRAARGGAHAPLLRVRARAHRHERAAGVPGRLGAGPRRHRHGLSPRTPSMPEGALAKLRAAIVNMSALADVARSLGLGDAGAAGQGRGAERRPRQVQHPGRRARGGLRGGLPRPGARRRHAS